MPIYEFKCLKCEEFFEILVMGNDEKHELKCPKCQSEEFERIMSSTNFAVSGNGNSGENTGASANTKTCSSGSCTTYNIPGPK